MTSTENYNNNNHHQQEQQQQWIYTDSAKCQPFKHLGITHLLGKMTQMPCQVVATPRQIRDLLDTPLSDNTVKQGYL